VADPLRSVTAIRYVSALREGGSLPGLVEADDDGLVDRTPRNPNLLVWHGRTWLINHGRAFFRQHRDRAVALVPDPWLGEDPAARRRDLAAFPHARLTAPRGFVGEVDRFRR
jgi:hypothetical protein